jgi:putative DNA primase/helicase
LIAYLQRAAGYTATGSTAEEVALFAQGPGASGKTATLEAIRAALGDYATVADFATFLAGHGDGDGPTPGVARLAGARMVCASEVGAGQRFNPARLKALTGGERSVARCGSRRTRGRPSPPTMTRRGAVCGCCRSYTSSRPPNATRRSSAR